MSSTPVPRAMSPRLRSNFNRRMRRNLKSPSRRLAVGLGCAVLVAPMVLAQQNGAAPSVAEAISQEVRVIFQKCRKAVVKIEATDVHGALSGSGFFVDPNGTILTSYTVGGESHDIMVSSGGARLPARRLVCDPRSGVAILKVDAETPFVTIGRSRDLPIAAPVIAIGYPMDLPVSPASERSRASTSNTAGAISRRCTSAPMCRCSGARAARRC